MGIYGHLWGIYEGIRASMGIYVNLHSYALTERVGGGDLLSGCPGPDQFWLQVRKLGGPPSECRI